MTAAVRFPEPDPETYCPACDAPVESDGSCDPCAEAAHERDVEQMVVEHRGAFGFDPSDWIAMEPGRMAWFSRAVREDGLIIEWQDFEDRCHAEAAGYCLEQLRDAVLNSEDARRVRDALAVMGIDADPAPVTWAEHEDDSWAF